MLVPNRNYSSPSYRYGFQGQEKDDEIKGNGNSINYKYRMHDPRVGRFFAVDPLARDYTWNSTYAFAENKLGLGSELEGKELKYNDGVLMYQVRAGEGPSHISRELNRSENREKYGYGSNGNGSIQIYSFHDVVNANYSTFKEKAHIDDLTDINADGYWDMNINEGDWLEVGFLFKQTEESKETKVKMGRTMTSKMHLGVVGYDISGGVGGGSVGASGYITTPIPEDAPVWGAGRNIVFGGISGGGGTPGFDTGFQLGTLNLYENNNPSLTNVLSGRSVTKSAGFIWPNGVGAKGMVTLAKEYSVTTVGPAVGTPGIIYGTSISPLGISGARLYPPMSERDSIQRATEWMLQYPTDSIPVNFLRRKGEIKDVEFKD